MNEQSIKFSAIVFNSINLREELAEPNAQRHSRYLGREAWFGVFREEFQKASWNWTLKVRKKLQAGLEEALSEETRGAETGRGGRRPEACRGVLWREHKPHELGCMRTCFTEQENRPQGLES